MKKPESKKAAEKPVQRIQESGGSFAAYMQKMHRTLSGRGVPEKEKERAAREFDDFVKEALKTGRADVWPAPASDVNGQADENWKRFEKELEQDIIRRLKP